MSELCPLDSRRSMPEIWSKLVLVHFTTMFAFCHLLSIRGERLFSLKPVFFFICPPLICLQCASALLLLFVLYGVSLLTEKPIHKRASRSALRLLFLHVGFEHEYTAIRDPESHSSGRLGSWAKTIGRALVLSVFGVQCIGSIVLIARRIHRGAAAQSDQRELELACGGLVVTLLTIPPLIWQPEVEIRSGPDEEQGLAVSLLLLSITWLADIADRDLTWMDDFGRCTCVIWTRAAMTFIVFNIRSTFNLNMGLHEMLSFSHTRERAFSLEARSIFFAYILTAMVLMVALATSWDVRRPRTWWHEVWSVCAPVPAMIAAVLGATLLFIPMLFLMSPVLNLPVVYRQWRTMVTELIGLAAWPTDRACPLLWEDPIASWLWNLA